MKIDQMSVEEISAKAGNEIYRVAMEWFQKLEDSGRMGIPGHHAAQEVAEVMADIIKKRVKVA